MDVLFDSSQARLAKTLGMIMYSPYTLLPVERCPMLLGYPFPCSFSCIVMNGSSFPYFYNSHLFLVCVCVFSLLFCCPIVLGHCCTCFHQYIVMNGSSFILRIQLWRNHSWHWSSQPPYLQLDKWKSQMKSLDRLNLNPLSLSKCFLITSFNWEYWEVLCDHIDRVWNFFISTF